jgi:hypothetical protein
MECGEGRSGGEDRVRHERLPFLGVAAGHRRHTPGAAREGQGEGGYGAGGGHP